jgi:hypothetical protein
MNHVNFKISRVILNLNAVNFAFFFDRLETSRFNRSYAINRRHATDIFAYVSQKIRNKKNYKSR